MRSEWDAPARSGAERADRADDRHSPNAVESPNDALSGSKLAFQYPSSDAPVIDGSDPDRNDVTEAER